MKTNTIETLRRTGRSTRMLENAKTLARDGRAVYVVADNLEDALRLRTQCGDKEATALGIKFETPASLGHFDWRELNSAGAHRNCVFLVDHYAIEHRFGALLEMLHRYDL